MKPCKNPCILAEYVATNDRELEQFTPKEIADKMTVGDVTRLLEDIKLSCYTDLFKENDVDGNLLFNLSVEDLKDMGISNGFHRRKIVTKFEEHLKKWAS